MCLVITTRGFDSASRSCELEDGNPLLLHDTPAFGIDNVLKVQWSRRYYCLDKHQLLNVCSDLDLEHSDPKFSLVIMVYGVDILSNDDLPPKFG